MFCCTWTKKKRSEQVLIFPVITFVWNFSFYNFRIEAENQIESLVSLFLTPATSLIKFIQGLWLDESRLHKAPETPRKHAKQKKRIFFLRGEKSRAWYIKNTYMLHTYTYVTTHSELHEKNEPQHNSRSDDMCGILAVEAADREERISISLYLFRAISIFIYFSSCSFALRMRIRKKTQKRQSAHMRNIHVRAGGEKKRKIIFKSEDLWPHRSFLATGVGWFLWFSS